MNANHVTVQRAEQRTHWCHQHNAFLSDLMGQEFSNFSFACALAFAMAALATMLLASDACREYGWAAFTATLAVNALLPVLREFQKGGDR